MEETIPVLLITANVGSIFENPDAMVGLWIQEFLETVSRFNVKFIALHCQEVGGKNYETRMQHVDNFVQLLVSSEKLKSFNRAVVFLDEDFSCAENFTALGNFYFVHESAKNVYLWNFKKQKYDPIEGKKVHSGNIEDIEVKEKSKFPQNFFPECKWSRKGYLRTRWSLDDSIFDLVNIHLFHDASNFVAMQSYPSVYTITRQKALQYTLNRFYNYTKGYAPFFLFGDFNFRTDTQGVVKKLTTGLNECKDNEFNNDDTRLEYKDETSEVVVSIGKKEFSHSDHQNVFNDSGEWLKEFDREMEAFKDQLFEFPITFLPSYPFEENTSDGQSYMKTRCPAWCDRVLLSMTAKQLIYVDEDHKNIEYGVIGRDSCMGDHKPVYLFVHLKQEAGIIAPKLPLPKVCSACKLSSSVFCDAFLNNSGESPLLSLKSHFNSSNCLRSGTAGNGGSSSSNSYEASCANYNCCKMIYHRNLVTASRHETNISPMSTVTELSDRLSDTDTDSYYLASAIPTLNSSCSMDICSRINDSCSNSFNDATSCPLTDCDMTPLSKAPIAVTVDEFIASADSDTTIITTECGPENGTRGQLTAKIKRHHFAEDNMSLNRFHPDTSKEYVSRSFDETTPVRSNSALNVIESSWRSKTCTCLHDVGWRMRSISSSSRTSSWNSDCRVRLKSDPNLKMSLPRIQSHHSSSDEEWFEEVAENSTETASNTELDISRKTDPAIEEIEECIEFEATPSSAEQAARVPLTQQNSDDKESHKKSYFLFCIPKTWRRPKETRVKELSDCLVRRSDDVWQRPAFDLNYDNEPVSNRYAVINQSNDNVIMKETTV